MSDKPLHIAFLWHMHQPYYKDPVSGKFTMPWVRLHGIKDYYDMVAILEDYPAIKQTFNMVPSLMDQILDYTDHGATDEYMDMTLKAAAELTVQDKKFLLSNFFSLQWDHMLFVYPRYRELLEMRGYDPDPQQLERASRRFAIQDLLDLQVWFNLAWFDPIFKERDPFLMQLIKKGRDFSEEDKVGVIRKQIDVLRMILPEYRKMAERGQIEITTSPYYHPILPLLCDTDVARVALPGIALPKNRFRHPEDARAQIKMGVAYHKRIFGQEPKGMWPSEGSVSEDILPLISGAGIEWIATDEEILAKSLDTHFYRGLADDGVPEQLYKPYYVERGGKKVSMIFRDHQISDLIGFVYSKWDSSRAVEDLIQRLHRIRMGVSTHHGDHLISIILDGENAWEYYKSDGGEFLSRLYERLEKESLLKTVRVSDYLRDHPAAGRLDRLFPGSWINHNFKIWIGDEEDNSAWDLLSETRNLVISEQGDASEDAASAFQDAWKKIYIAEGSDWCWWYGEEHNSGLDAKFDQLFRSQLISIYHLLGKEPPEKYRIPILKEERKSKLTRELVAFIKPKIDGIVTGYYEWLPAAFYDPRGGGGVMHQVDSIISAIYYGLNMEYLYVRLDTGINLSSFQRNDLVFIINIISPKMKRVEISMSQSGIMEAAMFMKEGTGGQWGRREVLDKVAAWEILEVAIPLRLIEALPNEEVQFVVSIDRGGEEIERWPQKGYLAFDVPTEDFEAIRWYV